MIKPGSLRDHLVAKVPELARDAERLLIFVRNGALVCTATDPLSFEYRYQLSVVVTDFTGAADLLMVPVLDWVRVYQHELMANTARREEIRFECEVLANDKVDVEITLPLTERVGVARREDGGFDTAHYPEPPVTEPTAWEAWGKPGG